MKYAISVLFVIGLCSFASSSAAQGEALRGKTFCFPAKDVPRLVKQLATVKPKRRNIVDVRLEPKFIIKDGGVWPERFYLAKDGEIVMDMMFSRETGDVPNFIETVSAHADADICVDDPTRASRPVNDEGLYFEMGLSPLFKSTPGQHSLAELEEAAVDGKRFYQKMLPDVISLFMPDTDYFAIKMKDQRAEPMVFAQHKNSQSKLALEMVKDMWIVSLDDLNALEALGLVVTGGEYDLQPVPSPKTLRRFGWGDVTNEN